MSTNLGNSLKVAAIFTFIGLLMAIGMAMGILINPEISQFHSTTDPQNIVNELSTSTHFDLQLRLIGVVFDTFFILGYIAIFYGLYLFTRNTDALFPKLGLILGVTTGVCDMIENAIHIALITGIPNGWTPDNLTYVYLWLFTFIKDLSSYMAGFVFIVLLLITLNQPEALQKTKITLIILFGVYVVVGALGIVIPEFLLVRNLGFVIDLAIAAFLFYRSSKLGITI